MKELTDKERSEIQEAEEARSVNLMYHHTRVQLINGSYELHWIFIISF